MNAFGTLAPFMVIRNDVTPLWQVGPFANPSETYRYYQLPFCQPQTVVYEEAGVHHSLRSFPY